MDQVNTMPVPYLTPLKRIATPKGDVLHALKAGEVSFQGFGEAYLTCILPGETKGWKKHQRMTLNLIATVGNVRFYVRSADGSLVTHFDIGECNYARLTVPPGYWVAFENQCSVTAMILNVASIEHDPVEADNVPLETWPKDKL